MEASVTEALDDLLGVLAGGAFTVLTASLIGRTALARLRPLRGMMTEAEGWILSYAIGSALLSSAMFVLCVAGWVTDASVVLLGAAATACWLRWGRWTWPPKQGRRRSPDWPLLLAVVLPASIYGVLYIVHTLAPETRSDAMGYHLGLVQRYYRASGFVPLTTNVYAQISQGAEMLYLFAYAIGRESAAKIVHFSFLVATVGAILCFARRVRCDLAGVFAAVVYFTCPVVIPAATSAYNDCALAFSLWMVFYVLVLWWRDPRLEWLALMGLVIGYAFAIKYTGVVSVAGGVAAAAAVLLRERDWRPALKCLAVAGGAAAAVGVPWLVKSAVYTGNPLAPFFNDVFRNPYISVEWESAYRFAMQSYQYGPFDRVEQFLGAPFELVFGERYAGSVGWMLLLLPAALLALRRPLGRALLGAAVVCALPWLLNAGARFLIPSVIFGAFALGLIVQSLPKRVRLPAAALVLAAQCLTSWPALRGLWYYEDLWTVEGFPWRAALRLEPQKWHLARNVEFFLLADRLDQIADSNTRVLSFFNLPEAYFQAELLVYYQGLENQDLGDALLASVDTARHPDRVWRAVWPQRPMQGVRIRQARPNGARAWTVSELRLLRDGSVIKPPDGLTISAFPHPWHARRLVDGRALPLWNSREPPFPGMSIEARFASDVALTGVELAFPRASGRAQSGIALSALESDSKWVDLRPDAVDVLRSPVDSLETRRDAVAMLREHRIAYVVLSLDSRNPFIAQSRIIATNSSNWALRRVFMDRAAVLFEVLPDGP